MKKLKRKKRPKKVVKVYPERRCEHISNGERCKFKAVGKSMFCKKHNGDPVVKENLLPDEHVSFFTKFDPDYHPSAYIELSTQGLSDVEIASAFNISMKTLKRWTEKYLSFNEAYEIGKAHYEAFWLNLMRENMENRRFNTSLLRFNLANTLGYADKVESKSTNVNSFGIAIMPMQMSESEWEKQNVIDVTDVTEVTDK
jgi:hypothetical protein